MTRSLRARISRLRGPGTSVRISIVLVVATPGAYRLAVRMVLSDRTIRRLLEEGRIGIDPYEEELLQPSSVDVRVDRFFRVSVDVGADSRSISSSSMTSPTAASGRMLSIAIGGSDSARASKCQRRSARAAGG